MTKPFKRPNDEILCSPPKANKTHIYVQSVLISHQTSENLSPLEPHLLKHLSEQISLQQMFGSM